jgi:Holliday junction DNA helicase RuvA
VIGFLKGTLLQCTPERALLDVQGVGYAVLIPLPTFYELEKAESDQAVGLWNEKEKLLFEKLILVSGIGPKLARVILSGMPSELLLTALAAGDTARLATIPGIGKKTAERMVVDLKDKVQALAKEMGAPVLVDETESDLVQALVNLGYKESLALRAVSQVREQNPEAPFHALLRLSLQRLARV